MKHKKGGEGENKSTNQQLTFNILFLDIAKYPRDSDHMPKLGSVEPLG